MKRPTYILVTVAVMFAAPAFAATELKSRVFEGTNIGRRRVRQMELSM